jgi:hypothetical protein
VELKRGSHHLKQESNPGTSLIANVSGKWKSDLEQGEL